MKRFLYLMCSLDESNASNAKLFAFLEDVGMSPTQFNLALMYLFHAPSPRPQGLVPVRRHLLGLGDNLDVPRHQLRLVHRLSPDARCYGGRSVSIPAHTSSCPCVTPRRCLPPAWPSSTAPTRRHTAAGAFGGVIAYGVGNLDGAMG
ncbi:hypothetical protein B0H67DRAFT_121145 [Lasiosphaeris hirsuta]|uniref:Uncharacterized protein n=1 Tax=Lasiosphaeris hirsuta TaxID=260670 RepID=A0AA40B023_9PEZI|nr:hypothetical protein B0H67DRAFT_121145 [Lasiosphaeris hirsuta]